MEAGFFSRIMENTILLEECSGFSANAAHVWETLRQGYIPTCSEDSMEESVYICFDEAELPRHLAVMCTRLKVLLKSKLRVGACSSKHFVALVSSKFFESPGAVIDLIGGVSLRDPETVLTIPPIGDAEVEIPTLFSSINELNFPDKSLIGSLLSYSESVLKSLRETLKLVLLRDSIRIFNMDNRPVPTQIRTLCEQLGFPILTPNIIEEMNKRIREVKPPVSKNVDISEWERDVIRNYKRKAPRTLSRRAAPAKSERRSQRKRKQERNVHDESDSDVSDAVMEEAVKLVVDNWLQCDTCSKWRVVDKKTVEAFEAMAFNCSDTGKSCSDPADDQT